jgi:PTS system mannose-specific IIA component
MIGMVIVTHGAIGAELLKALNSIVGPQNQALAITIGPEDDMEKCRTDILTAIKDVNKGAGVVLLTDMFGGTPSNLALAAMPKTGALVLAGVNLPMLVKLASVRGSLSLLDAAKEAEMAGRKYIQLVSENLAPASV